jgi:branched-chain amino acid transport system substrate-binding protein
MRKVVCALALVVLGAGTLSCSSTPSLVVGAIYPVGGSQGEGGLAEARGVRLAAELVNDAGGVAGRRIDVRTLDVPGADGAARAVSRLAGQGIRVILGSYGSTISKPAADEAARRGVVFWETGAVGEMSGAGAGSTVFRVAPTGGTLGRQAISFVTDHVAAMMKTQAARLRYAVAFVDDVYGRAVADGALGEIAKRKLTLAARIPYDPHRYDAKAIVQSIAAARTDVLFVSAYLQDGIALRKETVRQHVPLKAAIGTSSSFCMTDFGEALGAQASGLFASDKPDTGLNAAALTPEARAAMRRANALYEKRFGEEMDPPALAGFSAAWALFRHVLPKARSMRPSAVAAAARAVVIPSGGLPNGSGLQFGAAGTPLAGENVLAASVIWEWTRDGKRTVVWPPQFATTAVQLIPLAA